MQNMLLHAGHVRESWHTPGIRKQQSQSHETAVGTLENRDDKSLLKYIRFDTKHQVLNTVNGSFQNPKNDAVYDDDCIRRCIWKYYYYHLKLNFSSKNECVY